MSEIEWSKILGCNADQLDEMRIAGYAYLRQGKYDIALSFFEALIILDPSSAYDAQTLAALYIQLNQPAKAMIYIDRALKLDTDHGPTLLNLCKAFFMMGKKEEGMKLANILKNEPNPAIANVAQALLLAYG